MTVKDLIIRLLEEKMDTEVCLSIDDPHQDEHGQCEGYVFDIDSVSHEYGACMLKFTDAYISRSNWRKDDKRCKFRSQKNCDFCAFHSDCDEHWKEGAENG